MTVCAAGVGSCTWQLLTCSAAAHDKPPRHPPDAGSVAQRVAGAYLPVRASVEVLGTFVDGPSTKRLMALCMQGARAAGEWQVRRRWGGCARSAACHQLLHANPGLQASHGTSPPKARVMLHCASAGAARGVADAGGGGKRGAVPRAVAGQRGWRAAAAHAVSGSAHSEEAGAVEGEANMPGVGAARRAAANWGARDLLAAERAAACAC